MASRTALGPTQPPIQWVPGVLSLGVKRPGREADHLPPSSAEVKNAWTIPPLLQYVFMAWCLVKHRDNFTFTFIKPCYVGSCHHDIARPQVADGEDGLQMWRVAANILNNSHGQAIMGGSPGWRWVRG
jgi:hypothetical protein